MDQEAFPPMSGSGKLMRIAIGKASSPDRVMVNHISKSQFQFDNGQTMSFEGWSQYLDFWAFRQPEPGTIRIAFGHSYKSNCHRSMFNLPEFSSAEWNSGKAMTFHHWKHMGEFWAYPDYHPGTIRIAVGKHDDPMRMMVNHESHSQAEWNDGASMTVEGWEQYLEFWAFPNNLPPA